eukprot:scaffold78254_cov17-Tisochrysis_lutea.AAC.1
MQDTAAVEQEKDRKDQVAYSIQILQIDTPLQGHPHSLAVEGTPSSRHHSRPAQQQPAGRKGHSLDGTFQLKCTGCACRYCLKSTNVTNALFAPAPRVA